MHFKLLSDLINEDWPSLPQNVCWIKEKSAVGSNYRIIKYNEPNQICTYYVCIQDHLKLKRENSKRWVFYVLKLSFEIVAARADLLIEPCFCNFNRAKCVEQNWLHIELQLCNIMIGSEVLLMSLLYCILHAQNLTLLILQQRTSRE